MALLIDCYNVLHQAMPPPLAGLDEAGLCRVLGRSQWAAQRIVLVCDGRPKPHSPRPTDFPGIDLIHSGPQCDADQVLIQLIAADHAPRQLVVVSSDRQILKSARRRKVRILTSDQFVRTLAPAASMPDPVPAAKNLSDGGLTEYETRRWLIEFGYPVEPAEAPGQPDDDELDSWWRYAGLT